jgi:hypothetical protein
VRSESNYCKGFCETMSSLSMGEVQLPCARSNSFLDHKRRRRSTTRWIRGRSIKRSLPLRVWVHPQLQFTHQQLLQYTALLPRAHRTETVAALRDYGNRKLSCIRPLCLLCFVCRKILTRDVFQVERLVQSMQDAIPHRGLYVVKVHELI